MFRKYQSFLRWWAFFCIQGFALGVAYHFNLFNLILASDPTYLSFVILGIHLLFSLYVGKLAFAQTPPSDNNWLYFWIDRGAPGLGLLGLVVGIIIIFGPAFDGLNPSDSASIAAVIKSIGQGVGTKLFATAMGVVSSLLTEFQLRLISNG